MMILVTGGSGSGKSAYAEELAVSLTTAGGQRYYLATMQPFGEEGRRRIERHKKLREGKGFLTIEQPTAIHQALGQMEQEGGSLSFRQLVLSSPPALLLIFLKQLASRHTHRRIHVECIQTDNGFEFANCLPMRPLSWCSPSKLPCPICLATLQN